MTSLNQHDRDHEHRGGPRRRGHQVGRRQSDGRRGADPRRAAAGRRGQPVLRRRRPRARLCPAGVGRQDQDGSVRAGLAFRRQAGRIRIHLRQGGVGGQLPGVDRRHDRETEERSARQAVHGGRPGVRNPHLPREEPANKVNPFKWSSSQGPPKGTEAGTTCSVSMVVDEKKPYTYVIPAVRRAVGL